MIFDIIVLFRYHLRYNQSFVELRTQFFSAKNNLKMKGIVISISITALFFISSKVHIQLPKSFYQFYLTILKMRTIFLCQTIYRWNCTEKTLIKQERPQFYDLLGTTVRAGRKNFYNNLWCLQDEATGMSTYVC